MLQHTPKSLDAMKSSSLRTLANPSSLLVLLCVASSASLCRSFTFTTPWSYPKVQYRGLQKQRSISLSSSAAPATDDSPALLSISSTLPKFYPKFANILTSNGFVTPTPIQQSSALSAKDQENLLLIAATGSGKTLAYLLPALSRVRENSDNEQHKRRTVLIVAPTRELAAQLTRDASLLLPDETNNDENEGTPLPNVLLAVRGIPPPTPAQVAHATVLVGTPDELYAVLTRISGAQNFLAGDTLSGVILDEVDVLLPPTPKKLRTTFDKDNSPQQERKTLAQRRKLKAAQRRGVEFHGGGNIKGKSMDLSDAMNSQVLTPTERVLKLIAAGRYVGGVEERNSLQVLAGSATASRTTLDRLNKVLRWAGKEGGVVGAIGGGEELEGVWKGRMKVCRPEEGGDDAESNTDSDSGTAANESAHTIRAVTVPSVVDHRFVSMGKDKINNASEVLANVAKVSETLKPGTSLVFICGEFSRSLAKEKAKEAPKVAGNTSQARRNAKRKRGLIEKKYAKNITNKGPGGPEPLSVRKACSILQSMGVDAKPMHVSLGLEPNAGEGAVVPEEGEIGNEDEAVELPPVLVTFEGSARGLHFDGVDVVFVVGRPTSAASYLHLAGRIGRAVASDDTVEGTGEVELRPGTIVSFCSVGRATELEKWTRQVGATELEEIVV